jgi:hypothetical protein
MLKTRYQLLLLSFVVLGVYYPVLFAPYCSTDDYRMANALLNQDHFGLRKLFFPHGAGQYYRPLLYLTFIADKQIWGLQAGFMHLENVILHMGNALLVFFVARSLFKTWKIEVSGWGPLMAALVFALHPINTEAVDWISGRTDVLACFFVLLSLLSLLSSLNGPAWMVWLSGCTLLLGALTKESALFYAPAALFLVLCYDRCFRKTEAWGIRLKAIALPAVPIVLSALAYLAMRSRALSAQDHGVARVVQLAQAQSVDHLDLVRVVAKVTGFYLKKLLMPLPLNFAIVDMSDFYVIPGGVFLLVLCWLLYRRSLAAFLTVTAFCILSPSFLLAVSKLSWTPVAERYLYMPSAMFAMLATLWGISCSRSRINAGLLAAAAFFLLCGCAYVTTSRAVLWQDNYALSADTARKSPTFASAKNDMAVALMLRGDREGALRILETVRVDNFQIASLNAARVKLAEGDLDSARAMLYLRVKEPTGYKPEILDLLVQVAQAKLQHAQGAAEKRKLNQEILQLLGEQFHLTGDPFCQYRMGLVHARLDEPAAAFDCFRAANLAAPDGAHYKLAALHLAEKYKP